MNRIIVVAAILFTVGACQLRTAEPVNTSERIPAEQISLGGVLADELSQTDHAGREVDKRGPVYMATIEELQKLLEQTKSTGTDLDDTEIGERWENLNTEITNTFESLTTQDLNAWVALNDSLLKYTQQVRFADALERVVYNPVNDVLETDQVKSFYFTRLYDRIYFNVFGSSSLHYEHTTGGVVRIVQDTDYPFDGRVSIKLELQDKRYLDLFIRIPEWANRASVTVKGVKYNVVSGQYTEIAKKWKNGDEVEIILGMRPELVSREKPTKAFSLNYGSLMLSYPGSEGKQPPVFTGTDPIQHLKFVSPVGKMPTFTFSGIQDTTLVLQPFIQQELGSNLRTSWIQVQ